MYAGVREYELGGNVSVIAFGKAALAMYTPIKRFALFIKIVGYVLICNSQLNESANIEKSQFLFVHGFLIVIPINGISRVSFKLECEVGKTK